MRVRTLAAILTVIAASTYGAERNESIVKTFPSTAGKVVLVDAGPLDLTVRSAEIQEIRLDVELAAGAFKETQAAAWLDKHRPTIEDSETELRIHAPDPPGVDLLKGVIVTHARIELVVPMSVRPDLSTTSGNMQVDGAFAAARPLRLRAASGDVEFAGWAPEAEFRSTSGDLTLRCSRALERVLIRTAGGQVLFTGGAHALRCDSSSGDVRLEGLLGSASVATTSGSITVAFDGLPDDARVEVSSSSGKVRATLPPGSQPSGELQSSRGEIRSSYPGDTPDPTQAQLVLTGKGPKVNITTTSGRIELR
jgi:DUF4097 and DUF4098 domain-containing protein YvlB